MLAFREAFYIGHRVVRSICEFGRSGGRLRGRSGKEITKDLTGNIGLKQGFAVSGSTNCTGKLLGGNVFEKVTESASSQPSTNEFNVIEGCKNHNTRSIPTLLNCFGSCDPIHTRHANIHQNN